MVFEDVRCCPGIRHIKFFKHIRHTMFLSVICFPCSSPSKKNRKRRGRLILVSLFILLFLLPRNRCLLFLLGCFDPRFFCTLGTNHLSWFCFTSCFFVSGLFHLSNPWFIPVGGPDRLPLGPVPG